MRNRIFTAIVVAMLAALGPGAGLAEVMDMSQGHWTGGAAIGFLGNTPDRGADFAFKGNAEYFVARNLTVGPMVQYAGAGSQFIFGLTGMAKYYLPLGTDERLRLVPQAGIGFARLGVQDCCGPRRFTGTDSSFLLPIGVGLDYATSRTTA